MINSRRLLIKQGDSSAVAELNLAEFEDELLVLSGTPDNAELAQNIIERLSNEDPDVWLPVFLREVKKQREGQRGYKFSE